jgi:hypothetical protein
MSTTLVRRDSATENLSHSAGVGDGHGDGRLLGDGDGKAPHSRKTQLSWLVGAMMGVLFLALPAGAEDKVPNALGQEILIKTSLLTLNDANVTGNYTVLHAKLAKPLRDQFSPDRLKQSFKDFADRKIDWEIVAAKPPIPTKEAQIDERGALVLRGYFDAGSSHIVYELDFIQSEGEWKPIKLNVNVKPSADK